MAVRLKDITENWVLIAAAGAIVFASGVHSAKLSGMTREVHAVTEAVKPLPQLVLTVGYIEDDMHALQLMAKELAELPTVVEGIQRQVETLMSWKTTRARHHYTTRDHEQFIKEQFEPLRTSVQRLETTVLTQGGGGL